ncbi:hypothetical protein NQ317_013081 [Molorchus minor]|uniref:Cytochrome P450 n=1 Tax=Molorchus minor TaxID=1323400 RepID=A0ABQ9JD99_9CUCU|nr:hypothetical protein NQ317_013081 [Molorchus minor]
MSQGHRRFPAIGRALGAKVINPGVSKFFYKMVPDRKNYETRKDFLQLLIELKNRKDPTESSNTGKVRHEINAVMAKHGTITYDSMNEMKYMQQVIDETLRMYPPVPIITRQCVEDYKVPDSDTVIERGTMVLVCIKAIHHDEKYYPNPDKFDPDRFTEENKSRRHHYSHLPFGQGHRICIGERFGIMQTKVGLTTILKNFNVKLNNKTKLPLKISTKSIITRAEGDIWLNLEKLN